ncbi:Rpn family recombination-promoting nuclease/putative transposase [Planktothrix agardhii]|uniref:Rpn family recombination-promoting nuclease/putative transposase n=1 Tax=Planktothrix agardhii TaxID=1160 RepID=UPI0004218C14|nr:Rpn family recombination-promoting nuclease/putative transposase [Planktothrix agardhii]
MFDNICKFLAENFSEDLASWLLGFPIQLTQLSPTELSLEPIRADSLILLQSDQLVLHTEFQTQPDVMIPFRMLDYRVRVYRRFPQKSMRQVVIYLQPTKSPLVQQNAFRLEKTSHEFEVIRLWEQPTEEFLRIPGLLPFAVLSQTNDPALVLTQISQITEQIADRRVQSNLMAASAILAGLVLEPEVIQRIIRSDIMQESTMYQEILRQGKEQGRAEGRAEGLTEGRTEGRTEALKQVAILLLKTGMSLEQIAETTQLTVPQIQALEQTQEQENQNN